MEFSTVAKVNALLDNLNRILEGHSVVRWTTSVSGGKQIQVVSLRDYQ